MAAKSTSPVTSDPEVSRIVSLADLNAKVDGLISAIGTSGSKAADPPAESAADGSLQSQIDRAVARATEQERARSAAEKHREETQSRIKALEDRTEKPPRQLRRITRLLWGGDD